MAEKERIILAFSCFPQGPVNISINKTIKNPPNAAKNSCIFLWENLPAWNVERIVMGTLVDDFLEIHAIIGDIIFYGLTVADTIHNSEKNGF
jgi:hypothetical protein